MARPLRIEFPGAIYQVMSRGDARQAIFRDEIDHQNLLDYREDSVARYGWELLAFVLWTPTLCTDAHLVERSGTQYRPTVDVMALPQRSQ